MIQMTFQSVYQVRRHQINIMNTSTVCHLRNLVLDFMQLVSAAGQDLGGAGDR